VQGLANVCAGPSPSAKRTQALLSIVNALHKFAATRNCAVVVLSQCATKMHSERGATLTAAVNASVWEQGISTRLVMFRDWAWQENNLTSVFLAGLQKLDGKACQEVVENVVAFKVELVRSVRHRILEPAITYMIVTGRGQPGSLRSITNF
jgi:hypothetical protein